MKAAALLVAVLGCSAVKGAAGEVGGTIAEYTACPLSIVNCGHVFECAWPAATPSGIVEICIDDDDHPEHLDEIEALYRECWPTTRHQGLCLVICPPDTGRGANAYSGAYCPEAP